MGLVKKLLKTIGLLKKNLKQLFVCWGSLGSVGKPVETALGMLNEFVEKLRVCWKKLLTTVWSIEKLLEKLWVALKIKHFGYVEKMLKA
jgi:hypothetical protein